MNEYGIIVLHAQVVNLWCPKLLQAATLEMPSKELILPKYCEDVYKARRRQTRTVKVCLAESLVCGDQSAREK